MKLSFQLITGVFCLQAAVSAAVILDQPLAAGNGRASHIVSETNGFKTWESLTLTQAAFVDRITWIGAFIDTATTANNPVDPAGDAWNFALAGDAAGDPGTVLTQTSLPFASVSAVFLSNGTLAGQPVKLFTFTADLGAPIFFEAGTPLWLTIYSSSPNADPRFGWFSGSGGDSLSKQVLLNNGSISSFQDRALTLEGEAVPEPATLSLLGLGAAFLALRLRLHRQ